MRPESYKLSIEGEIELSFLNYGGIIQSLFVPDKSGMMGDVVLGLDAPEKYENNKAYLGAIIGRYANRIAEGRFTLNQKEYRLFINDPPHSLHGGLVGLDRVFWKVKRNENAKSYTLIHESPHLHEGYPGRLHLEVSYPVTPKREFIIEYMAKTDKPTPINLTNHSYFNLSGMKEDTILEHELWINSDAFTEMGENFIPTGEIKGLDEYLDFRVQKKIGRDIEYTSGGYDHNYILNKVPLNEPIARLSDPHSGRVMMVFTDQPGLQLYSGNFLDGSIYGKNGIRYKKHAGLCLETQHFPDSPHQPKFPNTILHPGEIFQSKTIYQFTTKSPNLLEDSSRLTNLPQQNPKPK